MNGTRAQIHAQDFALLYLRQARSAEFFRAAHQQVAEFHILCYTVHEI